MQFELKRSDIDGTISFRGEISEEALASLQLDPLDRALMDGEKENAADYLLVLEMLFRRHAEQNSSSNAAFSGKRMSDDI